MVKGIKEKKKTKRVEEEEKKSDTKPSTQLNR